MTASSWTSTAPSIEVIYLVFRDFGIHPFKRFISSYLRHAAGVPHRLVLAFKGFDDTASIRTWEDEIEGIDYINVSVPDCGFDIGTYLLWARTSDAEVLCVLNSKAVILADNWLAKLYAALTAQEGGAVAATGSWQGFASDPLRGVYPLRSHALFEALERRARRLRMLRFFPDFPNPHLRTNALMIARGLLLDLKTREPRNKIEAMRFESGWNGLTRQLLRRGERVAIVDRDGRAIPPAEWSTSDTFWQGDQDRLLIADNQTQAYAAADAVTRSAFRNYAWLPPSA